MTDVSVIVPPPCGCPFGSGPTWRLHTKLGANAFPNNARLKNRTDLNLGEVVYIAIIIHIHNWIYWMVMIFILIAWQSKPVTGNWSFYNCLFSDLVFEWQRGWRWPHCFCRVNQVVLMLTSLYLNENSRDVCIKAKVTSSLACIHRPGN